MPPAPANGSSSKSPNNDKPPNGEVKQRKRPGRVPVSCAECRRLKLRCDRKIPCETCVKRGCSAICPEGSLTTGKGNRLALADADELHKKVERLRNRVTTLEDALRKLQAAVSDDPHPLLQEGASESKDDTARQASVDGPSLSAEDEEFLDAFGTLTLGLRGESRFFGQTSRSEYLIHAPEYLPPWDPASYPHLTPELVNVSCGSLEMLCSDPQVKKQVLQRLPSLSRACRLCDIFIEYGEYLWCSLPRNQLFDEILGVIYRGTPSSEDGNDLLSTHAVSLLFMVFALASLFDMEQDPYCVEAQEYYLLARAALRFAPPVQDTTLWSIQSLVYMALFMEFCDYRPDHSSSHGAWCHVGLAVKLGHGIGLHVNSARWKLDEEATQRRSSIFWQLFNTDTWISFGFGRPPSISLAYVDCSIPKDREEHVNADGHKEWGFHSWSWQYAKVLHNVMSTAFGCKIPPYTTVIDLDRKVRDFPIPWRLRVKCGLEDEYQTPSVRLQRWHVMASKECTLLNLHRPYFAQALNEQPQDLLRHRYGPSVMAIYRSGWRLIEGLRETFKWVPEVLSRVSFPWSQALSGAIVMCLLVTRAPTSTLAQASLAELDRACELFEQAVDKSQIAANNVTIVQKLRRQAHEAMEKSESIDRKSPAFSELDRFGGKTHLVTAEYDLNYKDPCCEGVTRPRTTSVLGTTSPLAPIPVESIHPTIMQDMRSFEGMNIDFPSLMTAANLTMSQNVPPQQDTSTPQPQLPPQQPLLPTQDAAMFTQPSALYDPQFARAFPEVFLGEEFFSTATPSSFSTASPDANMGQPPVLDATWQSFVEQLGF
ncbi:hypothetical protein QCA50_002332 [Cerrena zonata]|uniref:Zn(2)-C6 fungal-type domain-containing protein n=1 Tax=Cerrena zonata TaxID=2478898 RepID=A0AAW0GXS4_9APHY